jgi:hypothetical protein
MALRMDNCISFNSFNVFLACLFSFVLRIFSLIEPPVQYYCFGIRSVCNVPLFTLIVPLTHLHTTMFFSEFDYNIILVNLLPQIGKIVSRFFSLSKRPQ